MRENLFCQTTPLRFIKTGIKAQETSASFEAIASHLELVHGMDILYVHFDRGAVGSLGSPHVQILVPPSLKIEGVIAVVKVGELRQEVKVIFGIQFRICASSQLVYKLHLQAYCLPFLT